MNAIDELREELHQRKEAFDRELSRQPLLEREQRLARWELFLAEVKPLALKLAQIEHHTYLLRWGMASMGSRQMSAHLQ